MQIILSCRFVVLPRGGREERRPVVRLFSVLSVAPDVIVVLGIIAAFSCLDEPRVFVGGVIHDEVHKELDVMLVELIAKLLPIREGAEALIDIPVAGDIIAHVILRGLKHGAEPYRADAQLNEIVYPVDNTSDIAEAVPVRVLKASRIYLIENAFLTPVTFDRLHLTVHLYFHICVQHLTGRSLRRFRQTYISRR